MASARDLASDALVVLRDEVTEIPLRPTGETDEDGDPIYARPMTAEEVRERTELNVANTASRLRARVLATSNGRGG